MPKKLSPSLLCPSEKVTEEQLASDLAVLNLEKNIKSVNRRSFLSSFSALGAAAATVGLLAATPRAQAQAAAPSIVDVLNFALNLEYLEANLYISASGGDPLTSGDGEAGKVKGLPGKLALDKYVQATAANLALDETHHIQTLRVLIQQLGGTPIQSPALDYSMGGKLQITTQAQFLAVARQFTAVGNSAYAGGAQYLVGNSLVLTGAGQILGAEAQHLGVLGVLCDANGVNSPKLDTLDYPPVPPNQYFTITPDTATPDPANFTGPALGPLRTTKQVLGIVFGVTTPTTTMPPPGVTSGGFFPQGFNGVIKST